MSTTDIFNFVQVDDHTGTAGQPTEDQLRDAAAEGYATIINLAPVNPPYTPPDEAGLVKALGLAYHYIPVQWNNPTDADFAAFEAAMRAAGDGKTLIHCAANFRVTAFYSLYAHKHLGWTAGQAEAFRARIWAGSHYPVWEAFVARKLAEGREPGEA